jgi:hypothetical protein
MDIKNELNDMLKNKQLLVVGGTGRDVGKTEFVCQLIGKISEIRPVYALKVSAIFPDEELYHGTHAIEEEQLHLFEETRFTTNKDTSRMLRAGARRVFYLRSNNEGIRSGFDYFLKIVPETAVIICESNSLGQIVAPALSIIVKSVNGPIKQRAISQLDSADLVIISDGSSGFPQLKLISYSEQNGWQMQSKPMQDYD